MVNVQLTDVLWYEVAVLAVIFLVGCVWVSAVDEVPAIDGVASIAVVDGQLCISSFDFGRATD